MIHVLLVDDHALVRGGIRRLLDDAPGITVIGEADSGEAALQQMRHHHHPDIIILMDVNMPGIGGLEATRKLLQIDPTLKVIIVTVHASDPFPNHFLQAGVAGYLTKGCGFDEMLHAIDVVHKGGRYIGADIAQELALGMMPGGHADSPFEKLSSRELQVMLMVAQGHKVPDISDHLCLSPKTVNTYRYRLFQKLGIDSDVDLTRLAIRHGMVER